MNATIRPAWPLLASMVLLATGCGGGGNYVQVSGTLLKGGAKYSPPADHILTVTLVAMDVKDDDGKQAAGEPYPALLGDDGMTFTVPGPEGRGIPPGKYRVALYERMTREAFEAKKPQAPPGKPKITRETDFFGDRFNGERSPIVREINGPSEITVDIDKPQE